MSHRQDARVCRTRFKFVASYLNCVRTHRRPFAHTYRITFAGNGVTQMLSTRTRICAQASGKLFCCLPNKFVFPKHFCELREIFAGMDGMNLSSSRATPIWCSFVRPKTVDRRSKRTLSIAKLLGTHCTFIVTPYCKVDAWQSISASSARDFQGYYYVVLDQSQNCGIDYKFSTK